MTACYTGMRAKAHSLFETPIDRSEHLKRRDDKGERMLLGDGWITKRLSFFGSQKSDLRESQRRPLILGEIGAPADLTTTKIRINVHKIHLVKGDNLDRPV
jgi:hypothetical protein